MMNKKEINRLTKLFVNSMTVEDLYPQEEIVEVVEVVEVVEMVEVEDDLLILDELKPMQQRIDEDFDAFSEWYKNKHGKYPTYTDYVIERMTIARQSR